MTDDNAATGLRQLQRLAELEADLFQANTTISSLRQTVRNQIEEIRGLDGLLVAANEELTKLKEPAF